jgi:hypothetical protein
VSRLLHSVSFTGLSTPMRRNRLGSRSSKFKYAIWQIVRGLAVGKCVENFCTRATGQFWFHFHCGSSMSFQVQIARFRFSPDSGRIASSHRSATKSADVRRGAAVGGELRQAAGAAA